MLSQFIFTELSLDDAVDLVLSSKITKTLKISLEAKNFTNKTLDKFSSFHILLAELQELYGM